MISRNVSSRSDQISCATPSLHALGSGERYGQNRHRVLDRDDLQVARVITAAASRLALERFRCVQGGRERGRSADAEIEDLIRAELCRARPGDAVLGEELGQGNCGERTSGRCWLVDPIDGTGYFERARPHWRIHLALEECGKVTVGVVTWPALGLTWWAARGTGAFEDYRSGSTRLRVSSRRDYRAARLHGLRPGPTEPPVVGRRGYRARNLMMAILYGRLDGCVDELGETWDHAPYTVLVEEAGGCWSDLEGGRNVSGTGGIFANRFLHGQLLEAFLGRNGRGQGPGAGRV
jgi:histidinol-phosphatase